MPDFYILLIVMAAAALACRVAGFVLIGLLPDVPRLNAALRATPLAVMAGIAALAAVNGSVADVLALGAVVGLTFLIGNDLLAALLGIVLLAGLRWSGL